MSLWVGADPGGNNHFGISVLADGEKPLAGTVSNADEAVEWIGRHISKPPIAAGVDAPLWWSSGRSGTRKADEFVRSTFEDSHGTVQAVNSLRGAALAQGMMFVVRLRETYGDITVTESHPKALLRALAVRDDQFFESQHVHPVHRNDHERDTLIGAIAAREGFSDRWTIDLSTDRYPSEQDPRSFWLAPIHYFWPDI